MATSVDSSHPSTVAAISSGDPDQDQAATPPPEPAPIPEPLPRTIEEFDRILDEDVKGFVTASEKVGGLVGEQVGAIHIRTSLPLRLVNMATHAQAYTVIGQVSTASLRG